MNWQEIENLAKQQGFGRVYVEFVVHEHAVTGANVQGALKSEMYTDNIEAGKDILKMLRKAKDQEYNGDITFTATIKNGDVRQVQYSPLMQVKGKLDK